MVKIWVVHHRGKKKHVCNEVKLNFDVLLTVHLSIFISVFNQLDAQNFVSQ